MCKILSSRIFRILVCLVLICCFLVNSSPIKAEAIVTEGLLTGSALVPVATVAAAILIALGVMAASDPAPFQQVVNDFATWLIDSSSYVVNGMVNVLGLMYADGTVKSFVLKDMIQDGWEWLFDSGVLSDTFIVPKHMSSTEQGYLMTASAYPYAFYYYGTNGAGIIQLFCGYSSEYRNFVPVTYSNGLSLCAYDSSGNQAPYSCLNGSDFASTYGLLHTQMYGLTLIGKENTGIYSSDDLSLGQIQSPYQTVGTDEEIIDIEIAPIYVDWNTGKVSQKPPGSNDDDEKIHLPIGFPSTDDDDLLLSQTQEQIQSGETNLEFDFESSGDGTGDGSGDSTGDSSGSPGDSSGSWQPPKTPMTVDLTKFFPFCIPFDLFEFFKLLNAEPVAPVLHWEMHDLAGETYSLTIDLSEWDSVALLFRRLQLFLFITGLAAASRKYIKW